MNTSAKLTTKMLVTMSLFITAQIILSRFLSISTPLVKIGFAFLPLTIIALLYGPLHAGLAAAVSDILGALLFPIGAYFPGFTVTAVIAGILYGVGLHNRPRKLLRIVLTVLAVNIAELILNTVNLSFLTGKAFWATLLPRLVQSLIMLVIKTFFIYNTAYLIASFQKKIENR